MAGRITIRVKPKDVIVIDVVGYIDPDHGEERERLYQGHCIACGALGLIRNFNNPTGWTNGLGYPSWAKNVSVGFLRHKPSCPMNQVLSDNGRLKRK